MRSLESRVEGWVERTVGRGWINGNRISEGWKVPKLGATQYSVVGEPTETTADALLIHRVANMETRDIQGCRDGDIPSGTSGLTPLTGCRPFQVKRMMMKPLVFSSKCLVRTILATFDNCARYNQWSDSEVTLSHQCFGISGGTSVMRLFAAVWYRDLRATLVQVYGSEGQAEVFRA